MTSLEQLKRAGAFIDPDTPKGRGRPKFTTIGALTNSKGWAWAFAVAKEAYGLGGLRGSQAAAIAKVARSERGYSRATRTAFEARIKQAIKRYPEAKAWGVMEAQQEQMAEELFRRTRGFPDDVKAFFRTLPAESVLLYLRQEGINGNCPNDLINAIRSPTD